MNITKDLSFDQIRYSGEIDEPDECPLCHFAIKPVELYLRTYTSCDHRNFAAALYLCKHCYQVFTVLSECFISSYNWANSFTAECLYIGPRNYQEATVPDNVKELSPRSCKIYNQALYAEQIGLDEIAGMGFRKAVEFLVKDYCLLFLQEAEREHIPDMPLSQCIRKIPNEQIRVLASRSAWIGNDEAHYTRKHEDVDSLDMKRFFSAMLSYVSMELTFREASSLPVVK